MRQSSHSSTQQLEGCLKCQNSSEYYLKIPLLLNIRFICFPARENSSFIVAFIGIVLVPPLKYFSWTDRLSFHYIMYSMRSLISKVLAFQQQQQLALFKLQIGRNSDKMNYKHKECFPFSTVQQIFAGCKSI